MVMAPVPVMRGLVGASLVQLFRWFKAGGDLVPGYGLCDRESNGLPPAPILPESQHTGIQGQMLCPAAPGFRIALRASGMTECIYDSQTYESGCQTGSESMDLFARERRHCTSRRYCGNIKRSAWRDSAA